MEAEASSSMDKQSTNDNNSITTKLKIAGAWSGVLEVDLGVWTVPMLREEVAKRSGSFQPNSINLICGGKVLKDNSEEENGNNKKLSELGFIKSNAKILASRVSSTNQQEELGNSLKKEEDRSRGLARIKAAAIALAKRHADGSLPVEDFNIELEDQSGQKVHLGSETDQRGLMMGLMLHANGKHLIKNQKYNDALDVLSMGEEAFSLCDPKVIEMIDNVSILQIDMVWCYFLLRDITWLSMAGVRLAKARQGLERSHGKDSARVRILQAGRHPELALYVRLELLEGVVAYHSGQVDKSWKALTSAQAKYLQLQVPDEALSLLMNMGYKERDAKRALRINNQDIERAVEFLVEEKESNARRREEDIRRKKEIREQKRYGMTALKKAVDIQKLRELVSTGFEKELAAEALRRNENDTERALYDLTNPEKNSDMQLYIDSKKRKRISKATDAITEELVSMGFERSRVVTAVRNSGTKEQALNLLTEEHVLQETTVEANGDVDSALLSVVHNDVGSSSSLNDANEKTEEERDVEMEDVLAQELTGDPFADYDIEVATEGEAITEYLAILASTRNA
ncbi:Ubiquitin-associated domain/translation elongation factor EF-Ts [Macleaya cordata]|uniref:Ubiquitin-associated domain/translation elongation factor EF-Ts n=1 Tax=Macleaya cordata TaxID=56857 RepID=A0A200PMM6_MACCD|nr:Ubiquitin-associated domain/translation elongation factor EF-Ts [Macleaya cordata]